MRRSTAGSTPARWPSSTRSCARPSARSSRGPPVIVLQGDHGPVSLLTGLAHPDDASLRERFRILNAYYLAGEADNALYPGITPVNSFRVVLNHVFGARCELLADRSYFPPEKPYQYFDVTPVVGEGRTTVAHKESPREPPAFSRQ